ncbi:hypothetical protein GCM10011375_00380 [Hymenobacter qilianensis]|uniref:Uncharacterized protein n=2 Tax=Hymenobacter qilianensis TaxID=1385715 RepID=A0ACB5PKV3_9BACT|nr:hypothetical protein [Hymenobacter qilianensis]QNP50987.1 hypothetical protein H9L05_12675 [Hymenobacter qilianensis]GGF48821.1 hypothetical protein GCM10011375_00380 [Hymenobacter qilianensis]
MKHILKRYAPLLLLTLSGLITSCDDELDENYTEVGPQLPTVLANTSFTPDTKYAVGETVPLEINFASQGEPIREVLVLQKVEPSRDSVVVQTIPYQPAYSRIKRADTLVVRYVVPQAANKAIIRVDVRVVSQNGQSKTRSAAFRVAEPTPTIRINSVSNVTAPTAGPVVSGDVVRYNLTLNVNGVTSATATTPATSILYKDLDSLITYVRVGTTAERRLLRQRLPAVGAQTGAATTLNVDAPVPANSAGQAVTFRFEAKVRTPARTASVSSAPITPAAATALAAVRPITLSYTGTTGGDQAAFNFATFSAATAADAATVKDIAITSIATNQVKLDALNTTRLVKTTAAVYNAATLNSIRQTYLTATAANQVASVANVLVGDVYVARVRGGDQYVIFTVTGLNRTATGASLILDVKAL